MINSRNLADLLPDVMEMAIKFRQRCADVGIEVLIYSTYRDNESQAQIYAQGRTAPGKIVTWAKPGESFHNYRCAFDFVPTKNGQPQWSDVDLYDRCGQIAEDCGLTWGGRWEGKKKDRPHCQYTFGLTLKDFQEGRGPPSLG